MMDCVCRVTTIWACAEIVTLAATTICARHNSEQPWDGHCDDPRPPGLQNTLDTPQGTFRFSVTVARQMERCGAASEERCCVQP